VSSDYQMMLDVYRNVGQDTEPFADSDVAHLVIHENEVVGAHLVPGFEADVEQLSDGVAVRAQVDEGAVIAKQVHMCFGIMPEKGLQRILLDVAVRSGGKVNILAHCMFPNALDVTHLMEAEIRVEDGATYKYLERHVHGDAGGVLVVPKAKVYLGERATFETEFELISGRVGRIDVDYETWCAARSSMKMTARIAGREDDVINVREIGHLEGDGAAGVLLSRIAVRDHARADVYNELTASAPYATGHVDCKEIVQDKGVAKATPIVEVGHPLARVTHEAAIGSVDSKQLQTLMARGLSEDDAVELIIRGLLRQS